MEVHVLDNYYLAITLLITIGYQLFFFSIAWTFKFDKLTDFAGGTNFVVLAVITLAFSGHHNARQIVVSLFIMVWGARLSAFLLFRILKTGTDTRFDDKRNKFFPFLGFWVFQMLWVWTVSLPVTLINSPNITQYPQPSFGTGRDIAGVILYALGLIMESVSDIQKYRFKMSHQSESSKGLICDVGFFSWSRHPNYFGEIIIQFAIFMIAVSAATDNSFMPNASGAYAALYASMLGAWFLTILLLFVSGLPLQERPAAKKRYEKDLNYEGYKEYLEKTSILIPLPPVIYRPLPTFVKRTVLLEWPMFVFDPEKHADKGKGGDADVESAGEQRGSREGLNGNSNEGGNGNGN